MLGSLINLIPLLRDHFSPLSFEVLGLGAQNLDEHGVISASPNRYVLKIRISNGNLPRVGIKTMTLTVDGSHFEWQRKEFKPLDTGDVFEGKIIFPAEKKVETPTSFKLTIIDSRQKKYSVTKRLLP